MPIVVSEPRVRLAVASDQELLEDFRCSTGVWYEELVERFVRERSLARALDGRLDFTLLLFETDDKGLVAVAAHHWRAYELAGATVDATYLVVAAIALPFQGARLTSGERLSDFVMKRTPQRRGSSRSGRPRHRPHRERERTKPRRLLAVRN